MITLIIGGADSGKSEYAEKLLLSEAKNEKKIYLATMEVTDEASCRIERHVRRRAGAGFYTIECSRDLSLVSVEKEAHILFEDVPNFVANNMFGEDHEDLEGHLLGRLDEFISQHDNVYFVTGDIASGGADYGKLTLEYMRVLGHVHRHLATRAKRVIEVVAGIPVNH